MLSEKRKTLLAILVVLSGLAAFFYKSVFLGKPIAKLGVLPSIDAMFNPALKKAILDFSDPSGYLIFFPNGHFEDSCWAKLVQPLWNPLVACGYPLVGDPQSLIFSPAHLLALFSTPQMYNAGLLIEIALGGIGMVLLCRFYKFSFPASIFSAIAYVLSPRILVQIDIGGNECFFPWIFLAFAWLADSPSLLRASITGAACALLAFSAHPETVFFAVLFAAMLCFASIAFSPVRQQMSPSQALSLVFKAIPRALVYLLLAALVSLAVAAPLIVPFIEFMKNAYLYKDEAGAAVTFSSWSDFLGGFYAGLGKEAFFIGAIAALLAPLGLLVKSRLAWALTFTLLLGMMICLPVGPIAKLLSLKPICYINTYYGFPEILLLLALLAGLALDSLNKIPVLARLLLLSISMAFAVLYPLQQQQIQSGTADFAILWKGARNMITATSIFSFVAFSFYWLICSKKEALRLLGFVILIGLNFASLALVGRNALPVNPPFSLLPPEPVEYLQKLNARSLSTGTNFFLPNANVDFAVEDFRCFSPLLPSRYAQFLKGCGAQVYNLYFYVMPDRCSALLNLASLKYVCTRAAVSGENESGGAPLSNSGLGRIFPGLRLARLDARFDKLNSQINAELLLKVHDNCNYRYALEYLIFDANGKEVWSGKETMISPARQDKHLDASKISIPVPLSTVLPASLCMRIKDTWISQVLKPEESLPHVADAFMLCKVERDGSVESPGAAPQFKLLKEFGQAECRIYENLQALPPAYLVSRAKHFKKNDREAVWKELVSSKFDARACVLIEDDDSQTDLAAQSGEPSETFHAASLKRVDCNTVLVDCDAEKDSYLVLTDAYYPGWQCFIDGKKIGVYPANYMFRAVKVQKGHHQLRFIYAPRSYYGAIMLSLCVLSVIAFWSFARRKELVTTASPQES